VDRRSFIKRTGSMVVGGAVLGAGLHRIPRKAEAVQGVTIEQNGPTQWNVVVTIWFDSQTFVQIDVENNIRSILPGNQRNNPDAVAAAASDWLQMRIDEGPPGRPGRVLLSEWRAQFPDDPAALADPAQPDFFWARQTSTLGSGGSAVPIYRPIALAGVGGTATHLIARPFLATFRFVNGTQFTVDTESPPQRLR
jgi:hypothetical protein